MQKFRIICQQLLALVMFAGCVGLMVGCGGIGAGQSSGGEGTPPPPKSQPPESLTYKFDNSRAGLNDKETTLKASNVNVNSFGKLMTLNVDGMIFAQPLYVSQLDMGGGNIHNVIYVATEHDSVYAFDADAKSDQPLWKRSFLDGSDATTTVPNTDVNDPGGRTALGPEVGITGTPVIDRKTNTLYVSAMTMENGTAVHKLHALDLVTGADRVPGEVITATVQGKGVGGNNGSITFLALRQNQRAGLVLSNGNIYVSFGAFSDVEPYHGWIFAFNAATLEQLGAMIITPDTEGGSIWQGGAAPAVDALGDIYVVTADGGFTGNIGGMEFGDSLLRLSFANNAFVIKDWFTPYNQDCLNQDDLDFGSAGAALLPDALSNKKLAIAGSKEGRVYLVDRDNMGHHLNNADTQILDSVLINPIPCDINNPDFTSPQAANTLRIYGSPGYWNGNVYVGTANGNLKAYSIQNNQLVLASQSNTRFSSRGPIPIVTSNGTADAIVWIAERVTSTGQSILHAYDATNLANELYNSNQNSGRDALGKGTVFTVPLVINGKAYVAAQNTVSIFGLLP